MLKATLLPVKHLNLFGMDRDLAHSQHCWPSQRNKIHAALLLVHDQFVSKLSRFLLLVCFAGVALVGGDQRSFQKRRIFCDPILHFEGPYLQLVLGTHTKWPSLPEACRTLQVCKSHMVPRTAARSKVPESWLLKKVHQDAADKDHCWLSMGWVVELGQWVAWLEWDI